MKTIAIEQARVLNLIPIEEIRPLSGLYLPDFIRATAERYGFASIPKDVATALSDGMKFEHGRIGLIGDFVVVKQLAIYNDGIIVDTHNTELSDAVLDDFFKWAIGAFNVREPRSSAARTYASVIIYETEATFDIVPRIANLISRYLRSAYNWDYKCDLHRIDFQVDPTTIPHLRNTQFFIERRALTPFSKNRYYSGAPLKTKEHVSLLEAIESELRA